MDDQESLDTLIQGLTWVTVGVDRNFPHARVYGNSDDLWFDHRCLHLHDYEAVHGHGYIFEMEARVTPWNPLRRHGLLVCPVCFYFVVGRRAGHAIGEGPYPPWSIYGDVELKGSPW